MILGREQYTQLMDTDRKPISIDDVDMDDDEAFDEFTRMVIAEGDKRQLKCRRHFVWASLTSRAIF